MDNLGREHDLQWENSEDKSLMITKRKRRQSQGLTAPRST